MRACTKVSGIGQPVFTSCAVDATVDQDTCYSHNLALLSSLTEDDHSAELMRLTMEDARLGRMTAPQPGTVRFIPALLWVLHVCVSYSK